MTRPDHKYGTVRDKTVRSSLIREPYERIKVALDLERGHAAVDQQQVHASATPAHIDLVDEQVRSTSMLLRDLAYDCGPQLWFSHGEMVAVR
jgi:hypothetical protein